MIKEINENSLSKQKRACVNGVNPYPIYAAVEKRNIINENKNASGTWFEFTPHDSGFPDYGAFVNTEVVGSKFKGGDITIKGAEKTICYLRGLWGSALADEHEIKTYIKDKKHPTTMDRILQEITTVSRRIGGMDAYITSLTLETKSMQAEIASFQSRVTGLEQRMGLVEAETTMSRDRDQDLLYLRSKLTDMEDRSQRDNIRLHGILENEEGADMQYFLNSALPKLTSLDFDPPIEFQRAHRVGPKRSGNPSRPRPIIACLLRHNQTRQILQAAHKHGPFQMDQHDIRITADYSKETNDRRKAFLAL
ncbi:hypothetical protein NDU88_004125 [Pleurodeles waltl]|uniref:PLA2c domain-containing protein n=1 Tax=Pleurodeles waltl TaxID=8319 RepID=A0AAV7QHH0_PLEWA|nr:hypothetical protein NDU88_004125 [Pleurodeles waltl]